MQGYLRPSLLLLVWFLEDPVIGTGPYESTIFSQTGCSFAANERPTPREPLALFPLHPEGRHEEEILHDLEEGRTLKRPWSATNTNYNNYYEESYAIGQHQSMPSSRTIFPSWMTSSPSDKVTLTHETHQLQPFSVAQKSSPSPLGSSSKHKNPGNNSERARLDIGGDKIPVNNSKRARQDIGDEDAVAHGFPLLESSSIPTRTEASRTTAGSSEPGGMSLPSQPLQFEGESAEERWNWCLLRENMQLSRDHSCQILNWSTPAIEPNPAVASHFMADEFLKAISRFQASPILEAMHKSHLILIPFVYKLMIKPISTETWARILLVWRRMWMDSDFQPFQAPHEVLRKFLWVSDFITESTIPQLFENAVGILDGSRLKNSLHLTTHQARTIRLLSDGRRKLEYITGDQQEALFHVKRICAEECIPITPMFEHENQYPSSVRMMAILNRLESKARFISPPGSEIEKTREIVQQRTPFFWSQNLWEQTLVGRSGETFPYLTCFPGHFKPRLEKLFRLVNFNPITLSRSSSTSSTLPQSEMDKVIKRMNGRFRSIAPYPRHHPPGFLPEIIRAFYLQEFKFISDQRSGKVLSHSNRRKNSYQLGRKTHIIGIIE
ncbi:hypothetical protein MJO29_006053 [Puccinia striiformis f. sp. tritici]|nr:hypothetical protein MJO29_006053 [Puccinia striiformis f. sp. tritici]